MGDNKKGQQLMDILRRIIGVALIVIGAVVAAHMIIEPLYHASSEASPNSPVWNIIDPFTALAVVLGVIFSYIRKRGVDHEGNAPITREFLAANTLFYGFLFVGLLFFWNWFNIQNPDFTGVGPDAISLGWGFIDAALPLLLGTMGLYLLSGDK